MTESRQQRHKTRMAGFEQPHTTGSMSMRWTDDKIESLAERLESNQCPKHHGCGTQPSCACADAEDAAEVLRQLHDEVKALRDSLNGMLDVSECAIERGDWQVDGACEPDAEFQRARRLLSQGDDQ